MDAPSRTTKPTSPDLGAYAFLAALAALFISVVEVVDLFDIPFESLAGNLWQTALTKPSPLFAEAVFFAVALASFSYVAYFVSLKVRRKEKPSKVPLGWSHFD